MACKNKEWAQKRSKICLHLMQQQTLNKSGILRRYRSIQPVDDTLDVYMARGVVYVLFALKHFYQR